MDLYDTLLHTVQDAWKGQYRIDDVRRVLRSYQQAICDPAEKVCVFVCLFARVRVRWLSLCFSDQMRRIWQRSRAKRSISVC